MRARPVQAFRTSFQTLHKAALAAAALLAIIAAAIPTATPVAAQGFQTLAPHAILMDYDTGTVLFEKAADELVAPASTAKTMAVEVIFNEIKQGRLNLDSEFVISENAWRRGGSAVRRLGDVRASSTTASSSPTSCAASSSSRATTPRSRSPRASPARRTISPP